MNVEEIIQQAASGDVFFTGSCDSGQNKGRPRQCCIILGWKYSLTKVTQS